MNRPGAKASAQVGAGSARRAPRERPSRVLERVRGLLAPWRSAALAPAPFLQR